MTDRHPVSLKSGCIILEPYCGPQEAIPLEIRVKQRFLKRETAEIRHPIKRLGSREASSMLSRTFIGRRMDEARRRPAVYRSNRIDT